MPDWTYQPLRPIASALVGPRRTKMTALRLLSILITRCGGRRWIPVVFDHPPVPESWKGRFGATVPTSVAREAIATLPVQGASIIEVGPVHLEDVSVLRSATADRICPVVAHTDTVETAEAVAPFVEKVTVGPSPQAVRLTEPDIDAAVRALATPEATVLATPAILVESGPGWFNRVIEAATPTSPPPRLGELSWDPRRWAPWWWGVLVGVGLIVSGLGAAAIALGPVLLFYDRAYLGESVAGLHDLNHHLVGFLQHDRITMAGNMIGIGILYIGLAWGGIRRGRAWARNALLLSGVPTFGTLSYFLVTGFVEPLHTLVVIVLTPMLMAAVWHKPSIPHWVTAPEGPEAQRRRALWGQLLMIGVGGGLFVAGAVISTVGLTSVFVPTDLGFLGIESSDLSSAQPHLLPFIAHDRAGFGGALMGAGVAVALVSLWGWRRGERWVWWSLFLGCAAGTAPPLAIHLAIGYTTFSHLLPLYVLILVTTVALTLSHGYLTARPPSY